MSIYGYNNRRRRQLLLEQQQKQNLKYEPRCTSKYLGSDNFIDFKKIREDFDIGGIFNYFSINKYLNNAETKKKIYKDNCENKSSLSNKNKIKCSNLLLSRNKAYKLAYNILSTYLKKKSIKRITKVADKPYKLERINKLTCALKALGEVQSNTNYCASSSDRYKNLEELVTMFVNKFQGNPNIRKLSEVFITSLIYNDKNDTKIIETLNHLKDDQNNKQFIKTLYDIINNIQHCPT